MPVNKTKSIVYKEERKDKKTKSTKQIGEEKKKKKGSRNQSIVVATVLAQCKHAECTMSKHCSGIAALYIKKWNVLFSYGIKARLNRDF